MKEQLKFINILFLLSKSLERSLPFLSVVYYYYSSHKSSLISKFERAFKAIKINERGYKETLRRYNFKEPRRQVGSSEQVNPISISNSKED